MTTFDLQSSMRPASESGEKPPNTTEWTAPSARAGEHGVGRLRDHRHVDGDAVALGDVAVAQDVGHPAYFVVQLLIGDLLVVLGIVAFPDDRDLIGARGQMPVDAVVGDVGDAVLVPLDRDVAGVADVLDLGRCLVPVEALGLVLPERARVRDRALVHFEVASLVDEGALLPLGRNVVNLVGHRFLPRDAEFTAQALATLRTHYATALRQATRPGLCDLRRTSGGVPVTRLFGRLEGSENGNRWWAITEHLS